MKKSLIILAAIATVAVGCTKTEVVSTSEPSQKAIGFGTYAMGTKAYTSGDVDNAGAAGHTNITEGSFGVIGYTGNSIYLGAASSTASATAAIGQVYNSTSSTWEYATPSEIKFWPATAMDFYAYFPYAASTTVKTASANGSSTTPLEIVSWTDGQDILLASALAKTYEARTALAFKHAFAKIKQVSIKLDETGFVKTAGLTVAISAVEIQATETTGSIKMSETGAVTYTSASSKVARAKTFTPSVPAGTTAADLIANTDNAYILPTGTASPFTGTGATMWDGSASTNVVNGKVCIKLTGKVHKDGTYYVGTSSSDGVIYIPMCTSTVTDPTTITSLLAGKRYVYNIVMKDNVGFDVNGNAILKPIKFSASVESWADDTTVTITL